MNLLILSETQLVRSVLNTIYQHLYVSLRLFLSLAGEGTALVSSTTLVANGMAGETMNVCRLLNMTMIAAVM